MESKLESILIPCKQRYDQKIEMLKKGGINNVDIVSDFDFTLTYGYSSFGALLHSSLLRPEFKTKL